MVYHKKPDKIANPGPLLGTLRTCRQAVIAASGEVKVGGTFYYGFHMVVAAIDSLAELMIRRPDYFWNKGSAPQSSALSERDRLEREAESGLRPWPDQLETPISRGQEPG